MALYKTTKDGNIPMSNEEEAEIIADWNREPAIIKKKTLEDRVADLERKLAKIK